MKRAVAVALLGSVVATAPARADFQIVSDDPVPAMAQQPLSGPANRAQSSPVPTRAAAGSPGVPIVQGFGRKVPLSFAVRQIVPAGIRVTLGPGVDPAAAVDWTGGRPWNEALRAAVRPLGLRVAVGWMTVSITRG